MCIGVAGVQLTEGCHIRGGVGAGHWMTVMSASGEPGPGEMGYEGLGGCGYNGMKSMSNSTRGVRDSMPGLDSSDSAAAGVAALSQAAFRRATSSPLLEARKERRLLDALKNQQLWLVRWMLSRDESSSPNANSPRTRPRSSSITVDIDPSPPSPQSYYEERDGDGRTPLHFAARWGVRTRQGQPRVSSGSAVSARRPFLTAIVRSAGRTWR